MTVLGSVDIQFTNASSYTWIKYADDQQGTNMNDSPTEKTYLGIAYNKTTSSPSSDPLDYTWSLIVGEGIPGSDGQTFYTWVKYADTVTGTGLSNSPTGKSYIGIAYNKPTETESDVPADYKWALIKGADGDDGVSITKVEVQYYLSTSATALSGGSWDIATPTWVDGKYMWSKTVTTYSNNTTTESTPACITGAKGSTGGIGKGVTSIVEQYYLSTSATSQTGGNWVTTVPTWVDGKYMWTQSVITYTDSTTATTNPICVTGGKGSTGNGITSVDVQYYLSTSSTTQTGGSWSTLAPAWVDGKYMWSKTVTTYSNSTTTESTPVCITGAKGSSGNDGKGVTSIVEQYYLSTSNTTQTGGSWVGTAPAWVDGKYIWSRSVITYTDNSTTTTNPVCVTGGKGSTGADGISITKVDVQYYLSTSATALSGGSWSTLAPAWVDGKYMWSKTVTTYSNSTTTESAAVCITGAKGSAGNDGAPGKGISSVTEYYLASSASSGVTTGTAGWTTAIQSITTTNKYLWNYEKITYTDSSTSNTTPVIIGVYGDTGSPGKGISSVTEYYLASSASSGVTTATAGWVTTVPTITTTNKYLWNYEKITYTDSSTTNTSPVIIGVYGDTGGPGSDSITGVLSNESSLIPTDSIGNNGNYTGATTTMSIFKGTVDDSTNWAVSAAASSGVVGSLSGKTYTVVGMTVDSGYIDLTATRSGYSSITKRYNISKSKKGIDANVGYSTNPYFSNWASTYPAGYSSWAGTPTKETAITFSGGNSLRLTATAGVDMGVQANGTGDAFGKVPEMSYYTLKFNVYLDSGTFNGSGFLLDFVGLKADGITSAYDRVSINLNTEIPNAVTGRWYQITKVVPISKSSWVTWQYLRVYVMSNYVSLGTARDAKSIVFDSIDVSAIPFMIDSLSAISANIGSVTAGTITGVIINGGSININDKFKVDANGKLTTDDIVYANKGIYSGDDVYLTRTTPVVSANNGALAIRSTNNSLYLQCAVSGQVNCTAPADPSTYVNFKAQNIIANGNLNVSGTTTLSGSLYGGYLNLAGNLDVSDGIITGNIIKAGYHDGETSATIMYIRPYAGQEVRVTSIGSTTTYESLRAYNLLAQNAVYAKGVNLSSDVTEKTNIESFNEDAIDIMESVNIYKYHFISDVENSIYDNEQIGTLAQTLPRFLRGSESNTINPYAMISVLWKACQQQQGLITNLQSKVSDLELLIGEVA
jgi:hypothetical protein